MNLGDLARLRVGPISGRLMGQLLFGEAILFGLVLGVFHRQAGRRGRGAVLGVAALGLFGIYVEAYRVEPNMLRVRRHLVNRATGPTEGTAVRILHVTDIQTPAIGAGILLHVSRGVGIERGFDVPVRFLCPPEICVLDVRLPVGGKSSRD